jgi:hypothetical protein
MFGLYRTFGLDLSHPLAELHPKPNLPVVSGFPGRRGNLDFLRGTLLTNLRIELSLTTCAMGEGRPATVFQESYPKAEAAFRGVV